ncbi:hypothetical protein PRIPAC_84535 [Pristionchus pacificus]|uniref:Uncharacterized protein n=1 Tax=Pristionchus pacificus TaxID=54126 RepID=A0A454Y2N1_PRIPA|nr:hypothetical protein PRIPAC_84535 [Pristionchus pacificus]|eukprot:PDM69566.1 hypothetical protein PRIPAC_44662 [Pristionchus pacificus]
MPKVYLPPADPEYRQAIRKAIWYLRHALEAMEEMSRGTKHEPDFEDRTEFTDQLVSLATWQAIRTSRSFDPANPNADLDEQELIRIAKYMSETKGNLA